MVGTFGVAAPASRPGMFSVATLLGFSGVACGPSSRVGAHTCASGA